MKQVEALAVVPTDSIPVSSSFDRQPVSHSMACHPVPAEPTGQPVSNQLVIRSELGILVNRQRLSPTLREPRLFCEAHRQGDRTLPCRDFHYTLTTAVRARSSLLGRKGCRRCHRGRHVPVALRGCPGHPYIKPHKTPSRIPLFPPIAIDPGGTALRIHQGKLGQLWTTEQPRLIGIHSANTTTTR
jgi:hypothetical protein